MDKATHDQLIQEMKDFTDSGCYTFLRDEYNRIVIKKLGDLHKCASSEQELAIRIKAGELSGFKNGFELMETLIKEYERKDE